MAATRRPGGGRRERTMTVGEERALRRGLDLATAEGLRAFLERLATAVLLGKCTPGRARAAATCATAQRALIIEANADVRSKNILKARDQILAARKTNAGMSTRDVGAPPDDKAQGLGVAELLAKIGRTDGERH